MAPLLHRAAINSITSEMVSSISKRALCQRCLAGRMKCGKEVCANPNGISVEVTAGRFANVQSKTIKGKF